MIEKLLIANRAEIARRIARTCRELGIGTVAVFSDPDADAPHVREADAAVRLPGATPAETYLRIDALVDAAKAAGADAVHPGYGFLSENADFARAVVAAGLTWVGPDPAAIEAMGSKVAAKKRMADAGVPVLPEFDPESGLRLGEGLGSAEGAGVGKGVKSFPLLVKASAGGGGRGMRVVRSADELAGQVAAARREAEAAFGDGTVFCEPLLENARHVEVQVLADAHGTVWVLGERECSVQRRHQKIIEETPSPAVGPEARQRLFDAATKAALAIGYVGAGTVEFLFIDDQEFHFLEVNTRLQVEHPVTEEVFGVDLVAWQLAIAEGERLPATPPEPRGHAVEARLYAEDPAHDWRPSTGVLHRFHVPDGVRTDSGVEDGSRVGVHYDPMLAKVIAWAPTRKGAIRKLAGALDRSDVHGLVTNRELLVRVLRHPAFGAGATHTGFLEQHGLTEPPVVDVRPAALAAALALAEIRRTNLPLGWRNLPSQPQKTVFEFNGETVEVTYRYTRRGVVADPGVHVVSASRSEVVLERDGVRRALRVAVHGDLVVADGVALRVRPRFPVPVAKIAEGATAAPMPGTVVRVAVVPGQVVEAGAELLVLEAMKMEHRVLASVGGVVAEVRVSAGEQVDAGDVLAVVEAGGGAVDGGAAAGLAGGAGAGGAGEGP
ncbi:biotin carboxylase N-terminal domain-containing protein [Actinosynnema sp. NPDC047251]|uniref:Acetyl-/propionyl-coenzyme A carboxylase alpha chain n=1 Tax=Saccharothrix espanaensis (strain ATCC 51144 / DSM 44229 / JCM 9112 / NBRC 15066 / NRRL 15764) TaxID=1179773 RepID=K0JV01_SACES|nr:biotin carboxylase N-terminal domain-containing protein [Saccharothrix espanaensis]CCH29811.1 Acetyl-/propionyl-coenzyme A carboxylase alpha chain [Saccharothrix espanaensis DSM 44229]